MTRTTVRKGTKVGAFALLCCALLSGCLNNRYIAPVTTFQSSTNQTIAVISAFYTSRNSYETQLYLADIAVDPTLAVATVDADGHPTPLGTPVFSPASIKARLDALSLVGVYASRLYALANTSAPADFATATTALGTSLTTLNTSFQSLGAKDPTANSYVGPISSLVGTVGKMYLSGKRDQQVKIAIEEGGPQVNIILSQIRDDMDNIFSAEVVTGANQDLATKVVAYNKDRSSLTYDQRVARLAAIAAASDAATSATASAPSKLVSSMMDANNALLKSAANSKQEKQLSLASLNDALGAWVSQIQALTAQIKPLVK
jgi:hypothetical protein